MHRPKLYVTTGANFLRAYSGVQYLAQSLACRGVAVQVSAPVPASMLHELADCPVPVYSYYRGWYGRLPMLRQRACRLRILYMGLVRRYPILCCDLHFYQECALVKRHRPDQALVLYCQELLTPEEHGQTKYARDLAYYAESAHLPDLVVEVNEQRAAKRIQRFGLKQPVAVLPNTLPLSEVPPRAPRGTLARLAGRDLPEEMPVLIYAGGIHPGVGFDTIAAAVAALRRPILLLAFCNGRPRRVRALRERLTERLGADRVQVCESVPRRALLSCMHEADAGLVHYPWSAEQSVNQLYCAPTKMHEYLAAGIPVVGSANPPLREVLEGGEVGVCAEDDAPESLAAAMEALLWDEERKRAIRERAPRLFAEELCYEKVSGPAVEAIYERLVRR